MPPADAERISLTTPRLLLRRPLAEDLPRIAELAGDWNVAQMLGAVPHPYRLADAEEFLREAEKDWGRDSFVFAIAPAGETSESACGIISLFSLVSGQPTLGFWLGEPYWGRGLMTEAVGALTAFAFERLKAPLLEAHYLSDNPASGRVLEKNGFEETGRALLWSRAHMCYRPGRLMRRMAAG